MSKQTINKIWQDWIASLPPEEVNRLSSFNLDPADIHNADLTQPSRYIHDDSFLDGNSIKAWREENQPDGSALPHLTSIIAKVIDALDCTSSREVQMHNDCIRIALGYRNYKSMSDVASKYGVGRAAISLRVKNIQRRLRLAPSIYMRSEQVCVKIKQGINKKK
jgi:hypothetical protein